MKTESTVTARKGRKEKYCTGCGEKTGARSGMCTVCGYKARQLAAEEASRKAYTRRMTEGFAGANLGVLTDAERAYVQALLDGMRMVEISEAYGVSRQWVSQLIRRAQMKVYTETNKALRERAREAEREVEALKKRLGETA